MTAECQKCPLSTERSRAVYDAAADAYVRLVGFEIGPLTEAPQDEEILRAFLDRSNLSAGDVIGDLGCGPGRIAALLLTRGVTAVGIDISPVMATRASGVHHRAHFAAGALGALPLRNEALRGALAWYSIIHTPRQQLGAMFAELRRVLQPCGSLLLAFQAGYDEPVERADAYGSGLTLTAYRHSVGAVVQHLETARFDVASTTQRPPQLAHETTDQAFIMAVRDAAA
ncbi:MAG TPA: class I SAM-dependent methyltransferase [Acidimicrobiales bacterium]|nr:class I SAM-dependent methyltransferase [Acidimicrobiales bacterium]